MPFYEDFASVYNKIFEFNTSKYQFLDTHLPNGLVLDIACATGQYTTALASRERNIIGIDSTREMIQNTTTSSYVRYLVKDMNDIKDVNQFNGIYSVGNTLVHITNIADIKHHLQVLYNALRNKGTLILQIINYDRIYNQQITALPAIHKENTSLKREYKHKDNLVLFQTALTVNNVTYENETPLYPLRYDELLSLLDKIGFTSIQTYGSFKEEEFDKDESYHLIVKATKPTI